jgi:MFS family permease
VELVLYQIQNAAQVIAATRTDGRHPTGRPWVNHTVLALGVTSLFTDISAEMISSVLPLYLVFGLGLSPLVFGAVDGIYTAASAPVRLLAGLWADRHRRHKELATAGYGLSTASRLGMLLAAGAWPVLAGLVLVDRVGKGIRTAPRDAMISLATPAAQLGAAFGVHRSLDTFGAMAGPVLAFTVLAAVPGGYDAVFVVSFCAGLIGLGVLTLLVRNPARPTGPAAPSTTAPKTAAVTVRSAARLVRTPRFAALLLTSSLLGATTLSDSFVYLVLQERTGFDAGFFPLLYVGTSLAFMVLAVPAGRLADRVGRLRVFVAGHVLLLGVDALLWTSVPGTAMAVCCLLLFGAYYAATDGVLAAMASAVLPPALRSSGLALLGTATSLARLLSSLVFGLLWTVVDVGAAIALFGGGLVLAIGAATAMLTIAQRNEVLVDDHIAR